MSTIFRFVCLRWESFPNGSRDGRNVPSHFTPLLILHPDEMLSRRCQKRKTPAQGRIPHRLSPKTRKKYAREATSCQIRNAAGFMLDLDWFHFWLEYISSIPRSGWGSIRVSSELILCDPLKHFWCLMLAQTVRLRTQWSGLIKG